MRSTAHTGGALSHLKVLEAQHARLESVPELSAAFQAIAHNTLDHAERITDAVGRLRPATA